MFTNVILAVTAIVSRSTEASITKIFKIILTDGFVFTRKRKTGFHFFFASRPLLNKQNKLAKMHQVDGHCNQQFLTAR